MAGFNVLEQAKLNRRLATNSDRIKRLESFLKGQLLGTVRFDDASITNAKVGSLGADKLTTGQLAVGTNFDIGDVGGGDYIRKSGTDLRILMYKNDIPQLVIGLLSGSPVIRISKDGYNVLLTEDINLIMGSHLNMLKTKATGNVSGTGDKYVAHGLSYVPIFFLVKKVIGSYTRYSAIWGSFPAGADATNLEFNLGETSEYFRYYIFYQEAA
jgi:hypothetical protein